MNVHEVLEMGLEDFSLRMTEHGTRLRRDHKYSFYVLLIQSKLALFNCTLCDFVVCTAVEEINLFR